MATSTIKDNLKHEIDSLNSKIGTVTTLTDNDDLNDLTETGMYYHTTSRPSNIPISTDYGLVVVFGLVAGSRVTALQFYSSTSKRLYYRRKAGNISDAWAGWRLITATDIG